MNQVGHLPGAVSSGRHLLEGRLYSFVVARVHVFHLALELGDVALRGLQHLEHSLGVG